MLQQIRLAAAVSPLLFMEVSVLAPPAAPATVAAPPAVGLAAPLHPILRGRWSPRAFDPARPVADTDVRSVLEAARWAPSSRNEQPWRFAVARREDAEAFEALLSCLNEPNRRWAHRAAVVGLAFGATASEPTGAPNAYAWHDVGGAVALMAVQATALGLQLHQMGGILPERIAEVVGAPAGFEPVEAFAFGHPAPADTLPDDLAARERAPRRRLEPDAVVFGARWGEPAAVLAAS